MTNTKSAPALNSALGSKITEAQIEGSHSSALTDSASNIFDKGLQQFFTPSELAEVLCRVLTRQPEYYAGRPFSVCDLTAGAGALLRPFGEVRGADCYGVELDPRLKNKQLGVESGNICEVVPYLRELRVRFDKFVLNPPFGLHWDLNGRETNSVEACLKFAADLAASDCEGVLICAAAQFDSIRESARLSGWYFWHVLPIRGLFSPVSEVECVVAFFSEYSRREQSAPESVVEWSMRESWLPYWEESLLQRRARFSVGYESSVPLELSRAFRACCAAASSDSQNSGEEFNVSLNGGSQIRIKLNDYAALKISKQLGEGVLKRLRRWSGLSVKYWALNNVELEEFKAFLGRGLLTIAPEVLPAIAAAVEKAPQFIAPFYPLKATQRLGYLSKHNEIECVKDWAEFGFVAGERYPLKVEVVEWEGEDQKLVTRRQGEKVFEETRALKLEGKWLKVTIGKKSFSESAPNWLSLIPEHFSIPDPGDITNYLPSDYRRNLAELRKLESAKFRFRPFQIDDLARLACREGAVLSWEQGLGKMIGGLSWALVRKYKRVLIVAPQDLIPQWVEEARDKFGIDLIRINSPLEARAIRERKRSAEAPEFYIIHYEGLGRNGTENKSAAEVSWVVGSKRTKTGSGEGVLNFERLSSKKCCPRCRRSLFWSGEFCNPRISRTNPKTHKKERGCGYLHVSRRVHPASKWCKQAFSAVIVDEGTKIKADRSIMGLAVRRLRPRGRLVLTGTPVKNFLYDSFWLLWWAAGASASAAFPYGVADKERFTRDFLIIESERPCVQNGGKAGAKKARPEICNLNLLWKVLAPNILRRRKVETGEALVSKRLIPVRAPFGADQLRVYAWWLHNFGEWYAERPDTTINSAAFASALAALLGQLWKLRFTTAVPAASRLSEFQGERSESNSTPKLLACLELIRQALESGESVVVFNVMRDASALIAKHLEEGGVPFRICDGETSPGARAVIMQEFKSGKFPVLLAGIDAVNLGHNLETARRGIVYSLPFDLASFDQAINRIHRLTSKQDIIVHVLLTAQSIDEKMWQLIERKGINAGLALDGALGFEEVEEIDWKQFARELREEFSWSNTDSVAEADIEAKIASVFSGLSILRNKSGAVVGGASDSLGAFKSARGRLAGRLIDSLAS